MDGKKMRVVPVGQTRLLYTSMCFLKLLFWFQYIEITIFETLLDGGSTTVVESSSVCCVCSICVRRIKNLITTVILVGRSEVVGSCSVHSFPWRWEKIRSTEYTTHFPRPLLSAMGRARRETNKRWRHRIYRMIRPVYFRRVPKIPKIS